MEYRTPSSLTGDGSNRGAHSPFKIKIKMKIGSKIILNSPAMSFLAALMYYPYYSGFNFFTLLANWMKLVCFNFPFAFFTQLFFIQPLVRTMFRRLFVRSSMRKGNTDSVSAA